MNPCYRNLRWGFQELMDNGKARLGEDTTEVESLLSMLTEGLPLEEFWGSALSDPAWQLPNWEAKELDFVPQLQTVVGCGLLWEEVALYYFLPGRANALRPFSSISTASVNPVVSVQDSGQGTLGFFQNTAYFQRLSSIPQLLGLGAGLLRLGRGGFLRETWTHGTADQRPTIFWAFLHCKEGFQLCSD